MMTLMKEAPPGYSVLRLPPTKAPILRSLPMAPPLPPDRTKVAEFDWDDDGGYALLGGMITQALSDLFHRNPEFRREALAWLLSPDRRSPSQSGAITFLWICETTHVESEYLLRKLRESALEKARSKSLKSRTSLDEYLRRLEPFLHPANGGGQ